MIKKIAKSIFFAAIIFFIFFLGVIFESINLLKLNPPDHIKLKDGSIVMSVNAQNALETFLRELAAEDQIMAEMLSSCQVDSASQKTRKDS